MAQKGLGKFKFIIGEGLSEAGPIHHDALGIGHHAQTIAKIAAILNIPCKIIL